MFTFWREKTRVYLKTTAPVAACRLCCSQPQQPWAHQQCQRCSPCQSGKLPFCPSPPPRPSPLEGIGLLFKKPCFKFSFVFLFSLGSLSCPGKHLISPVQSLLSAKWSQQWLFSSHSGLVDMKPLRDGLVLWLWLCQLSWMQELLSPSQSSP